jgi:hypothetical protein
MYQVFRRYLLIAIILAISFSGCNIVGAIGVLMTPPEKVRAQYYMPTDTRLLVLVKGSGKLIEYPRTQTRFVERINKHLLDNEVVASTINPVELVNLELSNPRFSQLSEAEIGRMAGATTVLVVDVERFTLRDRQHAPLWHCKFNVRIKIVSVAENKRLWPEFDDRGEILRNNIKPDSSKSVDPYYGNEFANKAVDDMADKVAKLFYDHTGRDPTRLPEMDHFEVEP